MSEADLSTAQRLRVGLGGVVWFLLAIFGLLGLGVVLIAPWQAAALILIASLVLAALHASIRGWGAGRFALATLAGVLGLSALVAFPVYYLAYLVDARPAMMPLITLSDGKKTVQFQGMQHIGAESFYKSVVFDLNEALGQGYRLYYEGVRDVPGRDDLNKWFNDFATQGHGDLNDSYKLIADGCGMQFQLDYFGTLAKGLKDDPAHHFAADVSQLDMKNEFDRLMREDPDFAKGMKSSGGDADSSFAKMALPIWKAADPEQQRVMGLMCRGFLSWALSNPNRPDPRSKVILDFRNRKLAEQIANSADQKIYVTYGAEHARGVVADLKAIDPAWRVVAVKWRAAIANPVSNEGPGFLAPEAAK